MTPPVSGGLPEQGLREIIDEALSVDGVNEDDAPERFGDLAATAWVCGYEAGQNSITEVLARAALERPRPALPPIKMSQDTTSAERVRCEYCGQQVIPLISHPCVALPPQTGNPERAE